MTDHTYEFALPLPISQAARRTALEFANQQPTATKANQVRLNTLAVLVVQDYFQLMEIPTDLTAGDSWDSFMRVCLDVADLELPGVGRLECRPVLPDRDRCVVPAETWEERVGYVVVQVDESAQEAQILGYVPTVVDEELPLSDLRSPEDLLDHLYALQLPSPVTVLSNWLQTVFRDGQAALREGHQVFAAGWQAVEQVLAPVELSPAYAFRRGGISVKRAKPLTLGDVRVALVVDVQADTADDEVVVRLELHPLEPETLLPAGLQLSVLDATDIVISDATTAGSEAYLEFELDGVPGEQFQVRIRFHAVEAIESFMI